MPSVLENPAVQPTLSVQIHRLIRASRHRVFEAWSRPEFLAHWFGPGDMKTAQVAIDLREGGAYRIQMEGVGSCEDADGDRGTHRVAVASGVYQRIIPNELLSFTWNGEWNPGEETLVTLEFHDAEGGTELILKHERFSTEASMAGHRKGWESSLSKLAKELEG